ncbi:MAG: hypothetical protein IPJ77_00790 [Planctomycetes bacterium]|nr:hypothetical protein [Planctomycetota bacterium]
MGKRLAFFLVLLALLLSSARARAQAPVAVNDTASVCAGGSVDINVLANDTSAAPLLCGSFAITSGPSSGIVAIVNTCSNGLCPNLCVRYTAAPVGPTSVSFTYSISSALGTSTATVVVQICRLTAPNVTVNVCANGTVDICLPITATPGCGPISCANMVLSPVTGGGTVAVSPSCTTLCPAPGCCVRYNAVGSTGNTATFATR